MIIFGLLPYFCPIILTPIMKNVILIALVFLTIQASAQLTVPQSGVNNYTICSGTLYDSGGPFGNYSDNSNGYTVLNPSNVKYKNTNILNTNIYLIEPIVRLRIPA
jgi:hypothetical protein